MPRKKENPSTHMKIKDIFPILGLRSKPVTYSYEVITFNLPKDGPVLYAQWLHPGEKKKIVLQEAVDYLRTFLSPGDVAIDIGAHTGDSTLPLALAVGRSGCVLALEPNPFVFPVLKKNSELNPTKINIIPLMFAATPHSGDYEFEYSDAGFCNGGLHEGVSVWRHGHAYKQKVRGENLQSYLETWYADLLPKIRFVKVDAEGFDYIILASLKNLIMEQKPFIKVEVFKHLQLAQRERLYAFLVDLGYDVYLIDSELNYVRVKLNRQDLMAHRHYDVFCIPVGYSSRVSWGSEA